MSLKNHQGCKLWPLIGSHFKLSHQRAAYFGCCLYWQPVQINQVTANSWIMHEIGARGSCFAMVWYGIMVLSLIINDNVSIRLININYINVRYYPNENKNMYILKSSFIGKCASGWKTCAQNTSKWLIL